MPAERTAVALIAGVKQQVSTLDLIGAAAGFSSRTSAVPPPPFGTNTYWIRSTDGHPVFTDDNGVNYDLIAKTTF